jgi:hypothetical protein
MSISTKTRIQDASLEERIAPGGPPRSVGPASEEPRSRAESRHIGREHDADGGARAPEAQLQAGDPRQLVDQRREAGQEEEDRGEE